MILHLKLPNTLMGSIHLNPDLHTKQGSHQINQCLCLPVCVVHSSISSAWSDIFFCDYLSRKKTIVSLFGSQQPSVRCFQLDTTAGLDFWSLSLWPQWLDNPVIINLINVVLEDYSRISFSCLLLALEAQIENKTADAKTNSNSLFWTLSKHKREYNQSIHI